MPSITGNAICSRIKAVRTINNISRPKLVDMLLKEVDFACNEHYVKKVEEMKFTPSFEFLINFRLLFNLRWEWLLEGKGLMVKAVETNLHP